MVGNKFENPSFGIKRHEPSRVDNGIHADQSNSGVGFDPRDFIKTFGRWRQQSQGGARHLRVGLNLPDLRQRTGHETQMKEKC